MLNQNPHILVFDSGIGGMGVVQALRSLAPSVHVDYLADTALFPYGEQPDAPLTERIVMLLKEMCQKLSPDLLIIACNTASTLALPAVRAALNLPVVGCVPPIRWAGRVSVSRTIGLLVTKATARRPYLHDLHHRFAADCRLIVHGSAHLAQLAEQAFRGETPSSEDVAFELTQLFSQEGGEKIDTIGLGCTHYTFLMPIFRRLNAAASIMWLDPAPAVAQHALSLLSENFELISQPPQHTAPQRCFVTAFPEGNDSLTQHIKWLGFADCVLFPFSEKARAF